MPDIFSTVDYGDYMKVGGVYYAKVASHVLATPQPVVPEAITQGDFTFNIADEQGVTVIAGGRRLLAIDSYTYQAVATLAGVNTVTLIASSVDFGVLRLWKPVATGLNVDVKINGFSIGTLTNTHSLDEANALPLNIAQGDLVEVDMDLSEVRVDARLYIHAYDGNA